MRMRFKGPSGTGQIEVAEDASIKVVFEEIEKRIGVNISGIKYGPPVAMKTLSYSQQHQSAKSLGLHGETLTIVSTEIGEMRTAISASNAADVKVFSMQRKTARQSPDEATVPWPEREGTLLLRVMPSDNSCLFTAFGGALEQQVPAPRLRRMMAEYIREHPETFSQAVLGSSPSSYCQNIQDPDRWGGGIELSILSCVFDIQICTFDVQTKKMMTFGEEQQTRCILVYSGIHYDRIAFSYSEAPHHISSLPPEVDRTIWSTADTEVLAKTSQLVERLHAMHYYTDTDGLILKCDVPGCEWIGSGQFAGRKHAEMTGHVDLSEVLDSQ